MKTYFTSSAILFLIVSLTSFLARTFGWYNAYWYTDIILHTLSGIALGILWIAIQSIRAKLPILLPVIFLETSSFAVFGSVLWEFWEFFGWKILPTHTQFYLPQLGDTFSDILCGLIGGITASLLYVAYQKIVYSKSLV